MDSSTFNKREEEKEVHVLDQEFHSREVENEVIWAKKTELRSSERNLSGDDV